MAERPPRGFTEDTNATPLLRVSTDALGPKRPCLVMIAGARLGEIFPIEGEIIIGREPEAHLRLRDDESISRRHARVTAISGVDARITDLGSSNGTFVDGERVSELTLKEGAKIRVGQTTVLKFALYDALEEMAQRQLLEAALRDGLTRAFNRRYFLQRLGAEMRFAERHAQMLALLLVDIDRLKDVNERHGHAAGDDLLRRVAELLGTTLRAEDVLARNGGDEFAVLARNIDGVAAEALAERLRREVVAAELGGKGLPVTVSIGIAVFAPASNAAEESVEQFIERVEAALTRAKQAGRNRCAS
jgi:diguanylate cyclase (GGDEF)-like protein